jgi:adenine phosphoribosyltransferase
MDNGPGRPSYLPVARSLIRTIPDFPRPGIRFRDITPLLADAAGFRSVTHELAGRYTGRVDKVAGIEARGFIFGAAIAQLLGAGFVPFRKPGKLPAAAIGHEYELEYGTNRLEVHGDAVSRGERVLVIDDLLATGGTAAAALSLLEQLGADVIECAFVIELVDLGGRRRIEQLGHRIHALYPMRESD